MLPSRGPIQVTLEDAGTVRVQPSQRPVQVRILRRPRPEAQQPTNPKLTGLGSSIDSDTSLTNNHNKDDFKPTNDSFEERLFPQRPSDSSTSSATSSSNIGLKKESKPATRQTISYLQAASTRLNPSSQCNEARINPQTKATAATNKQQPSQASSYGTGVGVATPPVSNTKKAIKTYQERADEYAKARLRILGSAFPASEEGNLTNLDDVNRILNLDLTSSSPNGTLDERNKINGLTTDTQTNNYGIH